MAVFSQAVVMASNIINIVVRIKILSHKESFAYQLNKSDKKITNAIASMPGSMLEQDLYFSSLALAL